MRRYISYALAALSLWLWCMVPAGAEFVNNGFSGSAPLYSYFQGGGTTNLAKVDGSGSMRSFLCDGAAGASCATVASASQHTSPAAGFLAVIATMNAQDASGGQFSTLFNSSAANSSSITNFPIPAAMVFGEYNMFPVNLSNGTQGRLQMDANGYVKLNLAAGIGSSGGNPLYVSQAAGSTVTANQGTPNSAANYWPVRNTDGTNLSPAMDVAARAAFFQLTNGTNTASVSAANALKVDGSAVTQPVSGTVAATQSGAWNIGTVTTLPTIVTNADTTIGGTTAPTKLFTVGGVTTDASPQYQPLPLTKAGKSLRDVTYGTSFTTSQLTINTTATTVSRTANTVSVRIKWPTASTVDLCVNSASGNTCPSGAVHVEAGESITLNLNTTPNIYLSTPSGSGTAYLAEVAE